MKSPRVTVLMSVYNGERYLQEAIDSILHQTFKDFEFLIIDDGSTDATPDIISSCKSDKIRYIRNKSNLGLALSLNRGIAIGNGVYIARMDADDICMPVRLERQFDFMEKNPGVGVCGTWVRTIGESDEMWDYPSGSDEIKASLIFESVLAHPSVMLRRRHFGADGFLYNGELSQAQDYALWVRCAEAIEFANIPEVLLEYRIHPGQTGQRKMQGKVMSADRVRELQLKSLGMDPTPEEMDLHRALSLFRFRTDETYIDLADEWLQRILAANRTARRYTERALAAVLGKRWFAVCNNAAKLGRIVWHKYWRSPLSQSVVLNSSQKLKFAIKCFLL